MRRYRQYELIPLSGGIIELPGNSPIAVAGTKHVLEYGRELQTAMQLKHNAVWNQAMILAARDMTT